MELIEVHHVSKDDVFLVDDARRDLLYPTGHLPQVRLEGGGWREGIRSHTRRGQIYYIKSFTKSQPLHIMEFNTAAYISEVHVLC